MRTLTDSTAVRERYQALVDASTGTSVYHTVDWLLAFRALSYELAFVEVNAETIVPFVVKGRGALRRAFSLPYDTYGGAVAPARETVSYDEVMRTLGVPSARIVDFSARTNGTSYNVERATTHIVPLDPDYDRVAAGYSATNRRAIRQSIKRGIIVRTIRRVEEVPVFYRFYLNSALKYGSPPLPLEFFESLYEGMGSKGMATFYLAWRGERPVAGNLVMRYKKVAYDWTWGYDAKRQSLRPTNALIDRAIRDEIAVGSEALNLGASPSTDNGSAQFKENFGARAYSYNILSKMGFYYQAARAIKRHGGRLVLR